MGNADIALRHITRRRPDDLANVFVPRGVPIEVVGWIDTQVTGLDRRLDKALRLRVAGEPRVLSIEFFMELRADVPSRIFEYLGFLFSALRLEAPAEPVARIESVAIILSGRRRRWPARGVLCTAWPGSPFSGMRFRIDAVYQRSVAELRARGSVLWLVFTPLARDATVEALRDVIAEIRAGTSSEEERAELYAALLILAEIDPWRHNLWQEIAVIVEDDDRELIMRSRILRDAFTRGREEGQKQGREEGQKQGREEAVRQLLGGLFARRIGRRPTTDEALSLVQRAQALGVDKVEDALLDLERGALMRWLAEPVPQ